ncbi:hypothetical protein EV356DRAFT_531014 [Viridothelium virens]|uniref:Uncharacterized protein n=1 Tax=Viridothelium virens TaxID=1048519 RepID=A0A6A6HEC2_VIRVR|nr:hypothetical protein EV356DRAFT_531014 [Viridothelium virens]
MAQRFSGPTYRDPVLPSMLSPSQPKKFPRAPQPPSVPFPVAEGSSAEYNATIQSSDELGQLTEGMSWKQGWDMIEEFFPEPRPGVGLLTGETKVEEVRKHSEQSRTNVTNLQDLKSSIFGSGPFQGVVAEQPKERYEEQMKPSTSLSQPNTSSITATNAQIVSTGHVVYPKSAFSPSTNLQSLPHGWLGRGFPDAESRPAAIQIAGLYPPSWQSALEIRPSTRQMYGAQVNNVFPSRLSPSTPSAPTGAQQRGSVTTSQAESFAPVERDTQLQIKKNKKKTAKKIPAEDECNKGLRDEISATGFGVLVPVLPKDSISATPQGQTTQDGPQSAVDVSMVDNSQAPLLENEALHVNQPTIPPKPHAQKARAPRQRKTQRKSAASATANLEEMEVARTAAEVDKEHPVEDTPAPKKRARKPAQPRKKDISSNAKAESSKDADVTAEIEVPDAAGMEVGDPATTEAESMIPAAAKSGVEEPDVKQGKVTRSRKKNIGGEKRKGPGMGIGVKAVDKTEEDTLTTNAAARNKRAKVAKVAKVGKTGLRKSARLSNNSNPGQE